MHQYLQKNYSINNLKTKRKLSFEKQKFVSTQNTLSKTTNIKNLKIWSLNENSKTHILNKYIIVD